MGGVACEGALLCVCLSERKKNSTSWGRKVVSLERGYEGQQHLEEDHCFIESWNGFG